MRIWITIILIGLIGTPLFSQHKLEGSILGYPNSKLVLLSYFGDKHRFADSLTTDGNGWFSFALDKNTPVGLYSLTIGKTPVFNLILNNEDIVLKFDVTQNGLPEFIFSIENLIYYDYLVQADQYKQKRDLLAEVLLRYPVSDNYYVNTADHLQQEQKSFTEYCQRILNEYPQSFVSHIVGSDQPMSIPEGFDWNDFRNYSQKHFLDGIDFNDTSLINTNVLTTKAIDYLAFYTLNNNNKEMQEHLFAQAVDSILNRAMVNGKVYDFLMEYLIEGFEMYGFDYVINHIVENYEPSNSCVNEDRKSELQKRMENLRELAPGKIAPDIVIEDIHGNRTKLADIDNELTLVVFWASWCPHCNTMMPGIKDLYNSQDLPDFEVLAISIDTSATDYSHALSEQATTWMNYAELKGWDSKAAVDYSIYATPTMFLLDKNRKILARPASVLDLFNELEKLGK